MRLIDGTPFSPGKLKVLLPLKVHVKGSLSLGVKIFVFVSDSKLRRFTFIKSFLLVSFDALLTSPQNLLHEFWILILNLNL